MSSGFLGNRVNTYGQTYTTDNTNNPIRNSIEQAAYGSTTTTAQNTIPEVPTEIRQQIEAQKSFPDNLLQQVNDAEYQDYLKYLAQQQAALQNTQTVQNSSLPQNTNANQNSIFTNRASNNLGNEITNINSAQSGISTVPNDQNYNVRANLTPQELQRIENNVLSDYINVTYHLSVTMLDQQTCFKIQQGIPNNTINYDQMTATHQTQSGWVIASTGEGKRNSATGDVTNYYSIKSLNLQNYFAPSTENPLLSTMVMGKLRIHEPVGFKFVDDIANMALQLGYTNINPGRVMYRIDLYWSGFDQDTGYWVEQIPLTNGNVSPSVISYYVSFTRFEATVDNNGTTYDIDVVPTGFMAIRPEEIVLDAQAVFSGESDTFGEFISNLAISLQSAREQRTLGKIKRNFKFYLPLELQQATFKSSTFAKEAGYLKPDKKSGNLIHIGTDVDLMTLLQGALENVDLVQKNFLKTDGNDGFTTPRTTYTIRFNAVYSKDANYSLNDYNTITMEYYIEPFDTFKKGTVNDDTIDQYMDPNNQLRRIDEILRRRMLVRSYSYLYTGENTEVVDFEVRLKAFYYEALNIYNDNTTTSGSGQSNPNAASDQINERTQIQQSGTNTTNVTPQYPKTFGRFGNPAVVAQIIAERNNPTKSTTPPAALGNAPQSPYRRLNGSFNEIPNRNNYTGNSTTGTQQKNEYINRFDDHLKSDMLVIDNLVVRGDPIWLLSPYASDDLDNDDRIIAGSDSKLKQRSGKMIFLKMFAPNQSDYMNPNAIGRSSNYRTLVGGFYEVLRIDSTFEDGRFTQQLTGAKVTNLNYAENDSSGQVNTQQG